MGEDDTTSALLSLFQGSGIVVLGLVFELVFRFVGKAIVARVLGTADFGIVVVGITLVGVLSSITTVGMTTGIGRYLPRSDEAEYRRGVVVSAVQVVVPITLAAAVLVFVGADWLATRVFDNPALGPVFRVTALAIPFAAFLKVVVGVVQGLRRTRPKVYLQNVTQQFLRLLLFAVAVAVGLGAVGVAWAYTLSVAVPASVGLYYLYRYTGLFDQWAWNPMRRELLSFSTPVMLRKIMGMILVNLDTFLLAGLVSASAVGVYGAVYPLAMLVLLGQKAASYLFLPISSGMHADEAYDEIEVLCQSISKWLLVFTVPVFAVMVAFPSVAIRLTYGSEYVAGALALSVLSLGFLFHSVVSLTGMTLEAIGSTRAVMVANLLTAALNTVLNLLLIPGYGILGAAVATTVAYLLLNALFAARLYQETRIVPFTRTTGALAVVFASLTGAVVVYRQLVGASLVTLFVGMLGFAVVYVFAVLRFGLDSEDLEVVTRAEQELGLELHRVKRVVRRLARY